MTPRFLPFRLWIGIFLLATLPDTLHAGAGDFQAPEEQTPDSRETGPVMTREEAIEMMGRPMDVTTFTDPQGHETEDWVYPNGQWLRFVDGKLKGVGSTDWTPRFPELSKDLFSM